MNGRNGPAVGTAYFPDSASPGPARPKPRGPSSPAPSVRLAKLPHRRRPGMIALAVALIGLGVMLSTSIYQSVNHRVRVVVVTAAVRPGSVLTASDVGIASVSAGPGVSLIPAGQIRQVVGEVAGSALYPGMLLTSSELATSQPPRPGQVLVPLPVRPSGLPASGLSPGDRVTVVAAPGAVGQSGTATAPTLTRPVNGVVEAVSRVTGSDGYRVVDVIVPAYIGPELAKQAATGQFALIVTSRRP